MSSRTVGSQRPTPRTDVLRRDWDALAAGYDRFVTPFTFELAEELVAGLGLRPGLRVLDVACGTGAFAIAAGRGGAQVVAVDLAGEMIERLHVRARARGLSIDGRVMDGQALAFDDRTFDVAASLHGVSAFPDVAGGVRELARVTRPGGRVVVAGYGAPRRAELLAFFLG
ncbi:MAG: methyltransferase domain-containing protein, partial [Actinobacteria bacterium]|nr:methyltransferase domain-containing protein [Actinomycetota bacterium]